MTGPLEENPVILRLREEFGEAIVEVHAHCGDLTAVVSPARYKDAVRLLKTDPQLGYDFLADLTAVDRLKLKQKPRFEVVVHLYSRKHNSRFRIKTRPENDREPEVDSIVEIIAGANWPEREVFDMFGIRFAGHPNLKRILMYDEFAGHPLRKDYPVDRRQPLVPMREIPEDRPGVYSF
jgi:NADH-quinone oxidoreductase subunit C